jgi:hypothetical protein
MGPFQGLVRITLEAARSDALAKWLVFARPRLSSGMYQVLSASFYEGYMKIEFHFGLGERASPLQGTSQHV